MVTLATLFWIALAITPLLPLLAGAQDTSDPAARFHELTTIGYAGISSFPLLTIGIIVIALLAPVKSINRRLLFLAIGTLLLVALNKISVLGLHRVIEAPNPPL